MPRLTNTALEQSTVVANCAMNRERGCAGDNSYAKELDLNPVEFLQQRLHSRKEIAWLDLCCGTGRALIEAAKVLQPAAANTHTTLQLLGVDLTAMFDPMPSELSCLRLVTASVADWQPRGAFDLVTCVHGLHYVGDKLRLVERAAGWLKPDGLLLTHLDPSNLKVQNAPPAKANPFVSALRQQEFEYRRGRHLLACHGRKAIQFDYQYVGADDQAGPNYTKQPAVDSYYVPVMESSRAM